MKITAFLFVLLGWLIMSSCTHENPLEPDAYETVYFDSEILPIFQNSCGTSGCHNSSSATEGYILNSFSTITARGIVPGNAESSAIYKTIIGSSKLMPPANPLPIEQRNLIRLWIEQGAENTITPQEPDPSPQPDTTGPIISFPNTIQPVLYSNCATSGCHDATTKQSGYDFTTFESTVSAGVVPNDAQASLLYGVITAAASQNNAMPPSPRNKLTEIEIASIEKWINRGAQNEDSTTSCTSNQIAYEPHIAPVTQRYCVGCHQTNAANGGVVLETEAQLTFFAQNGQLANSLSGSNGASKMPPDISLNSCDLARLGNWIDSLATPPPDTTSQGVEFCFSRDVHPILVSNCATSGCHDATTHKEGYNFKTYASTINRGVNAGSASSSKIYKVITTNQNEDDFMPPSPRTPLDADEIEAIKRWINEGALNETCAETCTPNNFDFTTIIAPIIASYCEGCHQSGLAGGGVTLETEAQIRDIAIDGRLINTLNATNGYSQMPPAGQLTSCQITQISNWVNALN